MDGRKIILNHQGALGDFLLAWPGMLAVVRQADAEGVPAYWAGKGGYHPFVAPLGMHGVPLAEPSVRAAVAACYGADALPPPLARARLIWFGVQRHPLPPALAADPRVLFVPILSGDEDGDAPPAATVAAVLARHGVAAAGDSLDTFRRLFGPWNPPPASPVLLIPGAGHPRKCWPLPHFLDLAESLRRAGIPVAFILGPDEQEQGWRIPDFPVHTPASLLELTALLCRSRAVVGNDSGPMHLAGMLGVPGVAMFGPTSERQWGPPGLTFVTAPLPCRPCTRTTRDLRCPRAHCLEAVTVPMVLEALQTLP